ncbi:sulfatase-like hydrolase/transferase [Polyangium spumosum]|uniref:Sulfatase-like hydrolase/transferase n=1 Tax=Polyangium spumosum TaxID=889282 RepID=A0A6N7PKG6_9BACT|nr:sulfatase-like hydrolase/transferase [Polyangium spumosum]MRG90604.1 sulfatase-like hydrolase/transferase [Polyangium spumosum]
MTNRGGEGAHVPPAAPRPSGAKGRLAVSAPKPDRDTSSVARPRARTRDLPLGWRIADGYLAIGVLLLVELVLIALVFRRELVGLHELGLALVGLWPIAFAAAAPAAAIGGVVVELARHAEGRIGRIGLALAAAGFAGAVAFGVSTGRLLSGGLRAPFVGIVAAVAFAGALVVGPIIARALAPKPRRTFGLGVFLGVLAVLFVVELVNLLVLPRLYPAFHRGLALLALLVAPFATVAWDAPRRTRPGSLDEPEGPIAAFGSKLARAALALGLFALSAAAAPSAAARLAPADNVRLVYLTRAPVLANAVEIAAALSPPPPLDDTELVVSQAQTGRAVDLSGRDIVLVTIDALRADHVGAYGYERKTTPTIDALAAEGVVFERAYTPTPHTSYAVTSLMTGKYIRPLVLQGLGADSETWAGQLRRYGYKTAAFFPPAVFFIDAERFGAIRERGLDFEYRKVEFASAERRARQVETYLDAVDKSSRVFLWVHLFEPHEPYEAHPEHPFGDRDIDRYDAEIAAADAGLASILAAVRARRPGAVVIVSADHGEEFQDHGGRYHGTTVYEEQVRVPLVVHAPGLLAPRRVPSPVQLVDLLPTVLSGLDIPRPARVRGADLGRALAGSASSPEDARGFAFSETETMTMLARGSLRLVCARRIGACALYDIERDPAQTRDLSGARAADMADMRSELRGVEASHGRYEIAGLRSEGKGWPEALRRGIAGDADAALDVAALLDDADVLIRRKAAEVLFELRRPEVSPTMRLALVRDEDDEVRRWSALTLTRLGEGAPRTRELLEDRDPRWRRLAALALAEGGDGRGEDDLVAWFREAYGKRADKREVIPFERAKEIVAALAKIRAKSALPSLINALDDVRLRPHVAEALAAIGQDAARPALAEHLATERYQHARVALSEALVALGAGPELRAPLIRLLGVPDPLPNGLRIALQADVLELVGGPRDRDLQKLRRFARSGVAVGMVVPKSEGSGDALRVLCRARSNDDRPGEIRFGVGTRRLVSSGDRETGGLVPKRAPELDARTAATLYVPPGDKPQEVFAPLPAAVKVRPGQHGEFVVYATQNVELSACAVVPLVPELPPPPPEPWTPEEGEDGGSGGDPPRNP